MGAHFERTGGTVSAPLINSRSADTVVLRQTGQTVIIGGLMQNAKAESVTRYVPGRTFLAGQFGLSHKSPPTAKRTHHLLTPYIIHTPTELASISDREREKSDARRLSPNANLTNFLDNSPATNQPPKSVSPKKTQIRL